MPIFRSSSAVSITALVFFGFVIFASLADMVFDIQHGSDFGHVIQEGVIVLVAMCFCVLLFYDLGKQKRENALLQKDLLLAQQNVIQVSQELADAKKAFGKQVKVQFQQWQLTEGEMDVALLTLKGFNSKEIGQLRKTSEKTVRNQLGSIYKKSQLPGKHGFISWFMDDLL